jgi:hypothetical protein
MRWNWWALLLLSLVGYAQESTQRGHSTRFEQRSDIENVQPSIAPTIIIHQRDHDVRSPDEPIPTWSGIAVTKGLILSEFIPTASVEKGLVAIFGYTMPHRGDQVHFGEYIVAVSVAKSDPRLGLMLLAANNPSNTVLPMFGGAVAGSKVRWLRFPHQGYPHEYILGVFSNNLVDDLPNATFVFNDDNQEVIGMVATSPASKKSRFVPSATLQRFAGIR